MPLRALAWTAAALFLVAGLAPLAGAKDPEERRGDERREKDRHGFLLDLDGNVTLRDNRTFSIAIEGRGLYREISDEDNLTKFKGRAHLKVTVTDENGTVVREGETRAFLRAKCNDEGECRWMLVSPWRSWGRMALLNVHGTAVEDPEGGYDLTGDGRIVVKHRGERAHAGKVEVTGDFLPREA